MPILIRRHIFSTSSNYDASNGNKRRMIVQNTPTPDSILTTPTMTEVIPSLQEDSSLLVVDVGRCVLVAGDAAGVVGTDVEGGEVGGNRI
jgi:hypothetical protein